ncbi:MULTISPECIES: SDR family oxidoreductase [unclassified Mycobacterium]|uniref:SDR family oxidoreductase n=1 Tax=unclassified Mycobacterium TaxID=2642494 RepID=UPI0007FB7D28|nr:MULTISPECIES: SDR family oxidoreductase [unclassified Mycobacterium]OBG57681.1 3-beta hydroxysteroid dehydrogenase [Mycobacterium sp. E188]OBG64098.1 3-beta hydroxysteroid dehydrogenase [Mycobacterium sp. E735]OBG70625.1 3-beta hydroxysteroid dehydrogenase [Mycobacterium sp. E3305]OBG86929.1 3-beta hydroxysteroid dehydrogenase [Mycobacterium sp. E3298]OBH30941.1 3-beta hydroxysteroid dehydrogenase [Mycobacterium sp. E1715]
MHVFVTGASGHIGSAVIDELVRAGHQVTGLARSDESAAALTAKGVRVHRGDLDDLDGLRSAAAASDGVIHLAFKHDFDNFVAAAEADLRAVEAIGEALVGSDRPFVSTSGTLLLSLLGHDGPSTEQDTLPGGPRVDSENAVIALAERGVRSSVIRLSPIVHSDLDHHGFTHHLINTARDSGKSAYIGEGTNRWPGVHTLDAAHLYRLALENAPAGTRLHGVADEGVAFRDIAAVIGRHLGVPTVSIPAEDAGHFGFLALFAALDNPTSSALTRKELDWNPERAGLLEDLDAGHYFGE